MNAPFGKDSRRFLALWFPYLGIEGLWRRRLGRSWRSLPATRRAPLVLSRRERNTQRIAGLDEQAEALGLRRGLGIADARAMHPAIEVAEADPAADRSLLEAVGDWCGRYTPLIAFDGEDGLCLDISGCAHLFGGEEAMLDDIRARLAGQGFEARAGIASTVGAAWAAARFSPGTLLAAGAEADFLAPLPLAALRLEPPTCQALESVGLRVAGAILDAPRAPLARRFGAAPLVRLDQALGRVDEAISPRRPVAALSAERRFAEPVCGTDDIEELVFMLAASARDSLERRGEGARSLELALFRVDGTVGRILVGTSRPVRDPAMIRRLFRERIAALPDGLDAGYGFETVRLSVRGTAPLALVQTDLSGDRAAGEEELAFLADRIGARLGRHALRRPVPVESHLPEAAVAHLPFAEAAGQGGGRAVPMPERPLRLFRLPEPVEAVAEVPEGPPLRFRWRRASHMVARAEGPERIAAEWWRSTADVPGRDYYRVEDEGGARYWLYREGFYDGGAKMPRWFIHGIFA